MEPEDIQPLFDACILAAAEALNHPHFLCSPDGAGPTAGMWENSHCKNTSRGGFPHGLQVCSAALMSGKLDKGGTKSHPQFKKHVRKCLC